VRLEVRTTAGNELRAQPLRFGDRRPTIRRHANHLESISLEECADGAPEVFVVVDDQDRARHASNRRMRQSAPHRGQPCLTSGVVVDPRLHGGLHGLAVSQVCTQIQLARRPAAGLFAGYQWTCQFVVL
jgi:hypothetical protein